jgi:Icc protein
MIAPRAPTATCENATMPAADPSRRYRILHLSDPHLTASGFDRDGVDAAGSLRRMLDACRSVESIDVVVVSGDIADDGSKDGCRAVLDAVGAFAAERDVPHVYTTGNHDDRLNFAAVLGSGHLSASGDDAALRVVDGPERAAMSMVDGMRIVTLDSLVPGRTPGLLDPDQLAWLREVLSVPAPDGTVIALHHPPIYVPDHPMQAVVLLNPTDLAEVVRGSDARIVLTGHRHHQLSGTLAGVPVWVTPGVVTRIDLTAPARLVRGVLGAGATVVDLGGPFSPLCHVLHARDPRAGEQVYLYDAETGTGVESEQP